MALTPDEQAASRAGWAVPEGNDLISGGDDAIRKNAVRARAAIADGDTATLNSATTYTDDQINSLPPIPTTDLATPANDGIMPAEAMDRIDPITAGDDDQFRVIDERGAIAFAVENDGDVRIGDSVHQSSIAPYRVTDQEGRIALEVDTQGRTHIYDLATGGDGTSPAGTKTLHVFVLAGQSNMSGRGQPAEAPTSNRVMQYGANRRVIEPAPVRLDMVDSPNGTSPAIFFAHNYLASQPSNVGVLLVPTAKGATAFVGSPTSPAPDWTWIKGAAPDPEFALYERSRDQALEAIAAARAAGYVVVVKGVLWHQGEGNGGSTAYADNLDALIADYRADLESPHLPFMVGQMVPEGMDVTPSKYVVDEQHRDTPFRTPFTGFAPASRNAHNDGDTSHFSTLGNQYLGDTYLTAYIQAVGNTRRN